MNYANCLPNGFIVVEIDEDIAGYMIFDLSGHVHSAAVKPPYRRKSFGTMMFMHACDRVKKGLWLEVRSRNTGARKFYEKLGMKTVDKIPTYYGDDDAVVMVLEKRR